MKAKDMIIRIVSKVYDRNPRSYRLLRDVWRAGGLKKMRAMVKAVMILPLNFIYNRRADKEIRSIKQNGAVFEIRGGG